MLKSLYIENILLIDKLELDFNNGLTIITGQTGAGKSILLESIGIILGDLAKTSIIRNKDKKAIISATFYIELSNNELLEIFKNSGFEMNQEIIIRKIISNNGSKIFLNDSPCTVNFIKIIAPYLLEIHSQFEQMSLLNRKNHLKILDKFGKLDQKNQEISQIFNDFKEKKIELQDKTEQINNIKKEEEYLIDIIKSIEKLNLKNDEMSNLEDRKKILMASEKISYNLTESLNTSNEVNFSKNSYKIQKFLLKTTEYLQNNEMSDKIQEIIQKMDQIEIDFSEIINELQNIKSKFRNNDEELSKIESRISEINEISRKFAITPIILMDFYQQSVEKYKKIQNSSIEIKHLEEIVETKFKIFINFAEKLSKERQIIATQMEQIILEKLKILKMEFARFEIKFEIKDPSINGIDDICFKGSMNPGLEMNDIQKIASGGELSRFMLALKTTISEINLSETIIFDEIDTGVSGDVAYAIGQELKNISKNAQVICVTHNPQITAFATSHLLVTKAQNNEQSITEVKKLNYEEQINAIAYMISGKNISGESILNAENLLRNAKNV